VYNPTILHRDWGWSSSDQRNRFVAQGVWQPSVSAKGAAGAILNGWMIAPNLTYGSAFPVSVVAGSDLNGDGVNNDYPLYQTRNQYRGYWFGEINMRISRTFALHSEKYRLQIIGEAENLLNSTNVACNTAGCTGAGPIPSDPRRSCSRPWRSIRARSSSGAASNFEENCLHSPARDDVSRGEAAAGRCFR
jgi:hypothetical protein